MKPIVYLLVATVFLMPLMGNTVLSEDISTEIYYFNSYDGNEAWEKNPEYMVDGNLDTCAETTIDSDVQLCDDNSYPGDGSGTITKVELRVMGKYEDNQRDIILQPLFDGKAGNNHLYTTTEQLIFLPWLDITEDNNAPNPWTWSDVDTLDCYVKAECNPFGGSFTLSCSIVQVRVTYT